MQRRASCCSLHSQLFLSRVCQTEIQKHCIKNQSIKQCRIQNQVSSLLCSKPNHRERQSFLSPSCSSQWLYYSAQHKAASAKQGEGRSFQAGPWWNEGRLQGQRRCGLNPVRQATMVLTNTSKLNVFFFWFLLRLFLCRAGSAGDALAPSGWPDGPGTLRLIVR